MTIICFLNRLGLGGTEKAACRWAQGLKELGHAVRVLTLKDGPRKSELAAAGLEVQVVEPEARALAMAIADFAPDAIHTHVPGYPQEGDVLGQAIALLPKRVPVVQTNIFGRLENPAEDAWTDYRLFISWTSCVQAARRNFLRLDESFFRRKSVAIYPIDPIVEPTSEAVQQFRQRCKAANDEVLFGRFSRPEPNKWTNLALDSFRLALRQNPQLKLLLREPPPNVAEQLRASPDAHHFIILPATSDAEELKLTMAALDVVLHTSSIGESFGYGIAEPMNLGKPVITHSVPWQDQAQIELVLPGQCGLLASTERAMAKAILELAANADRRKRMGDNARKRIRDLANAQTSVSRLDAIFKAAIAGKDNPFAVEDEEHARSAAAQLDAHQFGDSLGEQFALRPLHYRVRFYEFRKALRMKQMAKNAPRSDARSQT